MWFPSTMNIISDVSYKQKYKTVSKHYDNTYIWTLTINILHWLLIIIKHKNGIQKFTPPPPKKIGIFSNALWTLTWSLNLFSMQLDKSDFVETKRGERDTGLRYTCCENFKREIKMKIYTVYVIITINKRSPWATRRGKASKDFINISKVSYKRSAHILMTTLTPYVYLYMCTCTCNEIINNNQIWGIMYM